MANQLNLSFEENLLNLCKPALDKREAVHIKDLTINNEHTNLGVLLSAEVSQKYRLKGLPDETIHINFRGQAGPFFGNFLKRGITFELYGDAAHSIGKVLHGGKLIISKGADLAAIGGTALEQAMDGEAFVAGIAGERFAVRNSGATAIVEGVGDHGCEYMTGGTVVVLGQLGSNFAAGMSGGVAFVLDMQHDRCNKAGVELEKVEKEEDKTLLKELLMKHSKLTGSKKAVQLLGNWEDTLARFTKIAPKRISCNPDGQVSRDAGLSAAASASASAAASASASAAAAEKDSESLSLTRAKQMWLTNPSLAGALFKEVQAMAGTETDCQAQWDQATAEARAAAAAAETAAEAAAESDHDSDSSESGSDPDID